jgi:hypothetical protein
MFNNNYIQIFTNLTIFRHTIMKRVCVLLALFVALSFALKIDLLSGPAINDDLINEINSNPASTWVAGHNDRYICNLLFFHS